MTESLMQRALTLAEQAAAHNEVPVGAVIADSSGKIIASAFNQVEALHDPTAHAELIALRTATAVLKSPRLPQCDMYVTLEPCPMCAQAISFARVRRLYYGTPDPKGGGVDHGARIFAQSSCHHKPEVIGGMDEQRSATLLRSFFASKRT